VVPQYKLHALAECQARAPLFCIEEIENLYLQEKFMHNLRVGKRFPGNTTFIKCNKYTCDEEEKAGASCTSFPRREKLILLRSTRSNYLRCDGAETFIWGKIMSALHCTIYCSISGQKVLTNLFARILMM